MESIKDDGKFIMPLEEYVALYFVTTFTMDARTNDVLYKHNLVSFDFNNAEKVGFKFKLDKAIDCNKEGFAISVCQ